MRLRRVARVPDAPSAGWRIPDAKGKAKVEELPEEVAALRRAATQATAEESKKGD